MPETDSEVPCIQFIHEINARLGITPGHNLILNFNQMMRHNKKSPSKKYFIIGRNLLYE